MLKPPSDKITAETREKLLALADFIEQRRDVGFRMDTFFTLDEADEHLSDAPECGAAGCLAGFCNLMVLGNVDPRSLSPKDFSYRLDDNNPAIKLLRLTDDQGNELFAPAGGWILCNDRAKAIRVLRNFAFTGDVDWSV